MSKASKQRHALILIELRPLCILLGERLTWSTSAEQHWVWSFRFYPESECINAYVADICKLEVSIGKVSFEGFPSVRVVIQRERNLHASGLKAAARAAATDEEIIHLNSHRFTTVGHVCSLKPSSAVLAAHKSDSAPCVEA